MTIHRAASLLEFTRARARPRRLRSLLEFAEQEIVIPDGPYEGQKYRWARQPCARLWFEAVSSGKWRRFVATGPSQSGKTLSCFVIVALWHLFEVRETVICGLPHMEMAQDKWEIDLLPCIERTRFRELLPHRGAGSRGGRVEDGVRFANGRVLKFMSGGGSDKSRAGFTSRVLIITETDGMDESGSTSREADKIAQLEARTRAFGAQRRVYMECTVSTDEGRTWREYTEGTESRIVSECPKCQVWVSPEREHLVGWQDAENVVEARERAHFACPSCSSAIREEDRREMQIGARLVHRGQRVGEDGKVAGKAPRVETLGFRWSGFNNLLLAPGDLGADEWRAARSVDEDNAEREMRQFVWALPYVPSERSAEKVTAEAICRRVVPKLSRGNMPERTEAVTAALDLGKWLCHWVVMAWRDDGSGHVVDYGRIEVPSESLGEEPALRVALRQFREMCAEGWPDPDKPGEQYPADQVWVDAGNWTDIVYSFCREEASVGAKFRPVVGRGHAQQSATRYHRPKSTGAVVLGIGREYHFARLKGKSIVLVEVNADYWKRYVHDKLSIPTESAGALTLYAAPPGAHLSFAKHLTAEEERAEFVGGRGWVSTWHRLRRSNHWFDAIYYASAAAHSCGIRLAEEDVAVSRLGGEIETANAPRPFSTQRPFLLTQRE